MKLPKFFNIFGKKVKVKYDDLTGTDCEGFCFQGDLILIDKGLEERLGTQYHDKIVIHEFLHAALDRVGWYQVITEKDLEELLVENLSVALTENFEITPKKP